MKLLLLALVAVASAEPDSYFPYTTYNTGLYSGFYNGHSAFRPSVYSTGSYFPYTSSYYNHYVKRDADSDAFNYFPYSYSAYRPFAYSSYMPYRTAATVSEPVLKQGTFHTNLRNAYKGIHTAPVGQVYQSTFNSFVKRDADSDPYYYYPSVYNTAGVYNYPSTFYNRGIYNTYSSFPYRNVYSPFVKRDADSDSESYFPYSNFYSGYNNYPYRSTYASSYYQPRVYNTGYYNGYYY